MIGKVGPETLTERILSRTGTSDPAVRQGAAYGEDAAALAVGDTTLVVSTDPISLAAHNVGTIGVHVACNDVAASGGDPRWLTNVLFLPSDDPALIETIATQLDETASTLGVAIIGGHSEYLPALSRPLLAFTCLGTADRFVPTSGAEPGDVVLLTKGAGIEGTAILASDFGDAFDDVPESTLAEAAGMLADISVVSDAGAIRHLATAMHDPTEGGVLTGLVELALASGTGIEVDRSAVPIREPTRLLCDRADVDPLRIFGSGALLATVPAADREECISLLADRDIQATAIGRVIEAAEPGVNLDGTWIRSAVRDEMYRLWEE